MQKTLCKRTEGSDRQNHLKSWPIRTLFRSKCYPGLQSKNGHLLDPKKMLQEMG